MTVDTGDIGSTVVDDVTETSDGDYSQRIATTFGERATRPEHFPLRRDTVRSDADARVAQGLATDDARFMVGFGLSGTDRTWNRSELSGPDSGSLGI